MSAKSTQAKARARQRARRAAAEAARARRARRRQVLVAAVLAAMMVLGIAAFVTTRGDSTSSATAGCPPAGGTEARTTSFESEPPLCIDVAATYRATVDTTNGTFVMELDPRLAPRTVNNFVFLARNRYYDGITFHRVIPDFVVQGGDPLGDGTGGPGYTIPDELPEAGAYAVGSVAMAKQPAPDTGGSQFFIVTGSRGVALPPEYSLFGSVVEGMDVVKAIEAVGSADGTPTEVVTMNSIEITEV